MNRRAGTVLALVVGLLVLLAVVAGVVSATGRDPELPAGSPEAAVQEYVAHVYAGDLEEAAALLDPDGSCTLEDLERSRDVSGPRVVLRSTELDGDRASVVVDRVHGEAGPFGASEWTEEVRFELEDVGGRWVIVDEPWPMFGCTGEPEGGR